MKATPPGGALRCVALVGCTVHEAHLAAAAALTAHDGVERVTALVQVQRGSKAAPTVATLLLGLRARRPVLRCRARPCRAWFGPSANPGRRPTRSRWTLLRRVICYSSSTSVLGE